MSQGAENVSVKTSMTNVARYAVPAAIYTAKNLLQYELLTYVHAPDYQLLKNLNVLTTGVLYSIVLKKKLRANEWFSLALLTLGCTISQTGFTSTKIELPTRQTFVISLTMSSLSGFAGVYTEKVMKAQAKNIHVQNFYMYLFGMIFSFSFALYMQMKGEIRGWAAGFNRLVILMILNHALSGIAVSFVMKFANNIAKVKATSLAMLMTTVLSMMFLHFELKMNFVLGSILVCAALCIPTGVLG